MGTAGFVHLLSPVWRKQGDRFAKRMCRRKLITGYAGKRFSALILIYRSPNLLCRLTVHGIYGVQHPTVNSRLLGYAVFMVDVISF